jgi:hypothetical protein
VSAPLSPSADEARRLLRDELARSEYQSSKPGLLDRVASAFWDWVSSLRFGPVSGTPAFLLVLLLVAAVVVLLVVFLVYGRPRLNRRGHAEGELFGQSDSRTADALLAAADRAAATGDFALAIEEAYRSIARELDERGVLSTPPGTTARAFAVRVSALSPDRSDEILAAGRSFDEVRYLERPGTESAYRQIRELAAALRDKSFAGSSLSVTRA